MGSGYDYLAVGHVTIDVLADGSRQAGGTVLYSALQAARLGLRAAIVTRGARDELADLLAPFANELDVILQPSAQTTTLATEGADAGRRQRVIAWAGPMRGLSLPTAEIVHLAPVAAELSELPRRRCFIGLTPQGLTRRWTGPDAMIENVRPGRAAERLAARCHAMVLSEHELDACSDLIELARAGGARLALTAGERPTRLYGAGFGDLEVPAMRIARAVEDLGAGDVYASFFFVETYGGSDPERAARRAACAAAARMLGSGAEAVADSETIEQLLRAPLRSARSEARSRSAT